MEATRSDPATLFGLLIAGAFGLWWWYGTWLGQRPNRHVSRHLLRNGLMVVWNLVGPAPNRTPLREGESVVRRCFAVLCRSSVGRDGQLLLTTERLIFEAWPGRTTEVLPLKHVARAEPRGAWGLEVVARDGRTLRWNLWSRRNAVLAALQQQLVALTAATGEEGGVPLVTLGSSAERR